MKTFFKITLFLLFLSIIPITKAQIIDICGADTIVLHAGNYKYGTLHWEKSYNMTIWTQVPNAHDSIFKFYPTEDVYYRAVGKFFDCPPVYSDITHIQLPPVAHAGSNRTVPGQEVVLYGNIITNGLGQWTIITGTNGTLDDATEAVTRLQGTDSIYTLVWMLTNACGSSSDTIQVRFKENQYIEELVIVGSTDTLISNTAQLDSGIYVIRFSLPLPNISKPTDAILLGWDGDGYIRRLDSLRIGLDSTYYLYTKPATLQDLTLYGAYNLAQSFSIDSTLSGSKLKNIHQLTHLPSRHELQNNPIFKTGQYYYIKEDEVQTKLNGISLAQTKSSGALIDLSFNDAELSVGPVEITLSGSYQFYPNLVADLDFENATVNMFKIALNNAISEGNIQLNVTASGSGTLVDEEFTLLQMRKTIIVITSGVPIVINTELSLEGSVSAEVSATASFDYEYNQKLLHNASIEYSGGEWHYNYEQSSEAESSNNFNVNGNLTQEFNIGPKLEFKVFGIVGPYLDAKAKEELEICFHNLNWKAEVGLSGELTLGAKAEVLSETLFDVNTSWTEDFYNTEFPYYLEMISGDNQNYTSGNPVPQHIIVKVTSDKGYVVPGAIVHFNPSGTGTVSSNPVIADLNGLAEVEWNPGMGSQNSLEVYLKDCEDTHIDNSPLTFTAYEIQGGTDCSQSSLIASINNDFNVISVNAYMGLAPYEYSTDGITFSPVPPFISPAAGQTYGFTVRDSDGCYAFASYTAPANPCLHSSLSVNIVAMSNAINAYGSGGTPPYLFSLNNPAGPYTLQSQFGNLQEGTYTVYIKDATACVKSATVDVYSNMPPITANFTYLPNDVNKEDTVQFINMSNNATSWSWTFGDGSSATTENPQHVYDENSSYDVTLTVTNQHGTASKTKTIGVGCSNFTDTRDSTLYSTVLIGNQCWMKENLKFETPNSMCYNNNATLCDIYGRLYPLNDALVACPSGWHLPSINEWEALANHLGGTLNGISDNVGGKMKSVTPDWTYPNNGASNSSGFSARPAGAFSQQGAPPSTSCCMGNITYYWSSSQYIPEPGQYYLTTLFCHFYDLQTYTSEHNLEYRISVRCIKDVSQ